MLVRRIVELRGPASPRRDRAVRVLADRFLSPRPSWRSDGGYGPEDTPIAALEVAVSRVPDEVWPELLTRLDAEDRRLVALVARLCGLSEREDARVAVAERVMTRLIDEPSRPSVPVASAFVMAALARARPDVVPALEYALEHRETHWERQMPPVLAELGSEDALRALARYWHRGGARRWREHRSTREALVRGIGESELALCGAPDPASRLLGLEGYAVLRASGAEEAARGALEDEDDVVRMRAASVLAGLGDVTAIEPIRACRERATHGEERRAMLLALHRLGDASVEDQMKRQHAIDRRDVVARKMRAREEEERTREAVRAMVRQSSSRTSRRDEGWEDDWDWLEW